MTFTVPDLSGLSMAATIGLAVLLAFVDVAWNVILAIGRHQFSAAYVADFLETHIAVRVGPIAFLAILGNGIPGLQIPAVPEVALAATGGLALYFVETVGSLLAASKSTAPPAAPQG